jgi:hypothetical protein
MKSVKPKFVEGKLNCYLLLNTSGFAGGILISTTF